MYDHSLVTSLACSGKTVGDDLTLTLTLSLALILTITLTLTLSLTLNLTLSLILTLFLTLNLTLNVTVTGLGRLPRFCRRVTLKSDGSHDGSIISLNWAGVQCPVDS